MTQLRPLYELWRFWQAGIENYCLAGTHDKPCKSPSVLNLLHTNLGWSAFSFGVFLPSANRGQFQITPRKLPARFAKQHMFSRLENHCRRTLVHNRVLPLTHGQLPHGYFSTFQGTAVCLPLRYFPWDLAIPEAVHSILNDLESVLLHRIDICLPDYWRPSF